MQYHKTKSISVLDSKQGLMQSLSELEGNVGGNLLEANTNITQDLMDKHAPLVTKRLLRSGVTFTWTFNPVMCWTRSAALLD